MDTVLEAVADVTKHVNKLDLEHFCSDLQLSVACERENLHAGFYQVASSLFVKCPLTDPKAWSLEFGTEKPASKCSNLALDVSTSNMLVCSSSAPPTPPHP